MSVSAQLGEVREVDLSAGTVRYRERGQGEPLVFIHPMILNGDLWRRVVPHLAPRHRCITPDWPLGGHRPAMRSDADLTPTGVARLVAELIESLELGEVTLVGNDTGGAIAQIVAADHPERLRRLVLVTCDAFDNFPPLAAKPLVWFAQLPGSAALARVLTRSRRIQRSPLCFGLLCKRPMEPEIVRSYLSPSLTDRAVYRDARRALRALAPGYTLKAAEKLPAFDRPAMVVWNPEDRFFPIEHAHRLADLLPDSRLELIDDSYTFVPEDQPERLAELIDGFARRT
jgi:pimeloyl-ACP methyl ester carboxylesterase